MPTYEYECPHCGVFEVFQSMKEERLKQCPTCKRKVTRLLGTGAGLIFKGSGFYQTDYRGTGYASAAKADAAPSDSAAKTDGAKTETPKAEKVEKPQVEKAPKKKEKAKA